MIESSKLVHTVISEIFFWTFCFFIFWLMTLQFISARLFGKMVINARIEKLATNYYSNLFFGVLFENFLFTRPCSC